MKIDLHCHSTNSDGTWEVERILKEAQKRNIQALCISDHDNISGTMEAFELNAGESLYSGKLIPGIEISTRIEGQKAHLLAYFPSLDHARNPRLLEVLDKIKNSRILRMKKMIKKANELGMEVSFEEVLQEAATGIDGDQQPTEVISRPHLARVLVKKGFVKNLEEAFDRFLADGQPLAVERFTLKYHEWIELIHNVGGLIVWAHPLHGRKSIDDLELVVEILVKAGIDGVEYYYDYTQKYRIPADFEQTGKAILSKMIAENDLVKTAGGDFHGDVGRLGIEIPNEEYHEFIERLNSQY
ncbi:MAG: PHP domain-containing protein [Methanobacteriota archaeon]|nr:MAG: PHP domain-containing protein [Euryarchaeota archaeon]